MAGTRTDQKKLGDILVECRVVTQAQVDAALAEQRRSGKLFGEALIDLGFVSEEDLGWALSAQLDVPYIDLDRGMVDDEVVERIGADILRRHRLLPIVHVGDALTVAMSDPTNQTAIRELEEATGLTIAISIASPRQVNRILDEIFGPEEKPHEESGDLLFREITRPTLSDRGEGSARSNPLGPIFSEALGEKAREIHMEPMGDSVRVQFRRNGVLSDRPSIPRVPYDALVERLRVNLSGGKSAAGSLSSFRSVVEFSSASLELSVTLLPGPDGEALILEMVEGPRTDSALDALGLTPREVLTLEALAAAPSGLIVVAGPPGPAPARVVSALARAVDRETRKMVQCSRGKVPTIEHALTVRCAGSEPEGALLREHLVSARYIDVLVLGDLAPGHDFTLAVAAAAHGKLVLATAVAPDVLTYLLTALEKGAPRALTAIGLSALIEAREMEPGKISCSLFLMSPTLASILRAGATPAALERAARSEGFQTLVEQYTESVSEEAEEFPRFGSSVAETDDPGAHGPGDSGSGGGA